MLDKYVHQLYKNSKLMASISEAVSKFVSFAFAFLLPLLVDPHSFAVISILIIAENILEVIISFGMPELVLARQEFIGITYSFLIRQRRYVHVTVVLATLALASTGLFLKTAHLLSYIIALFCLAYVYSLNFTGITIIRCRDLSSYARQRLLWTTCRFITIATGLVIFKLYKLAPGNIPIIFLLLACIGELIFYNLYCKNARLKPSTIASCDQKINLNEALRLSKNFYLANIFGVISVYIYRIILPVVVQNDDTLARFYFCTTMATSSFFAIAILHSVLTPRIYSSNKVNKFSRLRRLLYLSVLASILMSMCIISLGYILAFINLGQYGFYIDHTCIAILCVGSFFFAVNDWIKVVFMASGSFKLVSTSALTDLLISCTFLPLILVSPNIYIVSISAALTPLMYTLVYGQKCLNSLKKLHSSAEA